MTPRNADLAKADPSNLGLSDNLGKRNGTNPVDMYENSIKVPFIVSHPGVLPQDMVPSAM